MNARSRLPGISVFLVLALLLIGFSGCSSVISGVPIEPSTVGFIRPGATMKAEVVENLGSPTWDWRDERGVAYVWQTGVKHSYYFGPKLQGQSYSHYRNRAFCIAYDEADRVVRYDFIQEADLDALEEAVLKWLRSPSI
jgi:hypothetical protein